MKWYLLRFVSFAIAAIIIIYTQDMSGWLWGIILGVVLIAFAVAWQAITIREVEAKEHKEYEQWVKEMNARANYRIEEF